jgi:hypothetical protein
MLGHPTGHKSAGGRRTAPFYLRISLPAGGWTSGFIAL